MLETCRPRLPEPDARHGKFLQLLFHELALTMGTEKFYDYLYAFGLGQSTGSGLVGESEGIVTHQKYVTQTILHASASGKALP